MRKTARSILLAGLTVLSGTVTSADAQFFTDDFDGTAIDGSKWQIFPSAYGSITVGDGEATFTGGNESHFASIKSSAALPASGDFAVEVRMQYDLFRSGCGTGFMAFSPLGHQMFSVWGWTGHTTASNALPAFWDGLQGSEDTHTYRFELIGNQLSVAVDGTQVMPPATTTERPSRIVVGNDYSVPCGSWTAFRIDYVHVEEISANSPPDASTAAPSVASLWPPNNKMVDIDILGVTDPDGDDVIIEITGISNDETDDDDADGVGSSTAQVRAARDGKGDGRTYTISFVACDADACSEEESVEVSVPHDQGKGQARGRGKAAGMAASSWADVKRSVQ